MNNQNNESALLSIDTDNLDQVTGGVDGASSAQTLPNGEPNRYFSVPAPQPSFPLPGLSGSEPLRGGN